METAAPANSTVVSVPPSFPANYVTLKHLQELRHKEKQQQQQHQQQSKEEKIEEEDEEKKEEEEVIDLTETRSRRDSRPRWKKFGHWRERAIREANLEDPDSGCGGDELISRDVEAENVNREEPKASVKANIEAAVEATDGGCRGSTNLEAKLGSAGEEPKATKKHNYRKNKKGAKPKSDGDQKNGAKPKADGDQKNGAKPNADGEQKSAGGEGKLLQTEDVSEELSSLSVKEMEENYVNRLKKIDRQKGQVKESPHAVSGDMATKRFNGNRGRRRGSGRGGPSLQAIAAPRKDVNVMWVKKETCLLQESKNCK